MATASIGSAVDELREPRSRGRFPFAVYFVFLVLIFVLSAAASVVYVQLQSSRDARTQARSAATFAATAASKQLGEQIDLLRATVGQLASNPGITQALVKPAGCTLTFAGPGGTSGHLDVLRLDGAAVCSSRARGKDGRLSGYLGERWVRRAATSPVFVGPLTDRATGAPTLVYAAPVSGKAVVAGFIDLTSLGPSLDAVYGGNRHSEFLVVGGGRVVARSIDPRRWIGSPVQDTAFGREGVGTRHDLDGTRRIYASASVPGTDWRLLVGEDEARALAAGNRLRDRELVIVLSSLALVLFATFLVYRRVVVPVKQLSDAVKATASRGRFTPLAVAGPAEVAALANELNALMTSANAQEAVRRAKEEAERANEAKSRFLSHMSHELRTPLAAIMGFAELLQRHITAERERQWATRILEGGQHLLALVNDLQEIARIEAGKIALALEPVDVRSTADEVLLLSAPLAAERGIHLEPPVVKPSGRAAVADAVRLKQILLNLVSNAIKYNREGGTVSVFVEETEHNTVRLAVTDTGEGIPADTIEKLFRPFERLGAEQGPVEGSGLGLVVTKGLVEAMQGRLEVATEVGTGTTFAFELPAADAAPVVRDPLPAHAAGETAGDVLYIEDNPVNLQIVEAILADLRPRLALRTATAGSDGAELAEAHRPDLLLLDLNLPDMTGEEVLRRLRARTETADVPILILSADSTSRNITRLLQTGADAYLTKPLDVPQFLSIVDQLLTATA